MKRPPLLPIAILAILFCGAGGVVLFRVLAYLGPHSVLLKWNAPASKPGVTVTSYNILRSTRSGGPYDSLVSGVTNLSYTDSTVSNGTTYYYVVRAVDSAGNQSPYSEETPAKIP